MKTLRLALSLFSAILAITPLQASWESDLKLDAGFSQTQFNNWASGGENSQAWSTKLLGDFTQTAESYTWRKRLRISYGRLDQAGVNRKTEDELRYENIWTFAQEFPTWKPYASIDLLTQLDNGYASTTATVPVSFFFDPAFLTQSAGAARSLGKKANIRLGVASKQTYTNRTTIVDNEAEVGVEIAADYKSIWFDEFRVVTDVKLFNNGSPLNDTDVLANFTISSQLTKHIQWIYEFNLIYNTDITEAIQTRQANRLGLRIELI